MEDEEYASRLYEILTNQSPSGIDPGDPYGQADDGIDRYDGFGRDVVVQSVDVVSGPHGLELIVGFEVALPPELRSAAAPREGTVRLPFDAEWRALSGYTQPAAYAPHVAAEVMGAAGRLVESYADGSSDRRQGVPLPDRAAQWRVLLEALRCEGEVAHLAPGRIEVRPSEGDLVTVVVTPDQWEDVLRNHAWADPELYIAELLGPRDEDESYVVFYDGDLARSTREELPPVQGRAIERRLAELRVEDPDARPGWYAHSPEEPRKGRRRTWADRARSIVRQMLGR